MKEKIVSATIIFLIVMFYSCSQNKKIKEKIINQKTTIGEKQVSLPKDVSITKTKTEKEKENVIKKPITLKLGNMTLLSSGKFAEYKSIKINHINFDLVKNKEDTIYLTTADLSFKTIEGYGIGTKFSDLTDDIQKGLIKENGWGYYYKLTSGWSIGFCEGKSCTDNFPDTNSKVKWIFKRK